MLAVELYKESLTDLGCTIDEDEVVLINAGKGEMKPFKIGGLSLRIPTKPVLKENDWSEYHAYHPLCEDVLMGQSLTIHALQKIIKHCVVSQVYTLVGQMLEIGHKPALQATVNSQKANKHLESIVSVTASTSDKWQKVWDKMAKEIDELCFNMYLKRDVEISGVMYKRAAILSFPILDEEKNPDNTIFGVKMSANDKKTILNAVKYVLKTVPLEIGSNAQTPYFDACMRVASIVLIRVNTIAQQFRKVTSYKMLKLDWAKELDSMSEMIGRIPKLQGNDGADPIKQKAKSQDLEHINKVDAPFGEVKVRESEREQTDTDPQKRGSAPLFNSGLQPIKPDSEVAGGRRRELEDQYERSTLTRREESNKNSSILGDLIASSGRRRDRDDDDRRDDRRGSSRRGSSRGGSSLFSNSRDRRDDRRDDRNDRRSSRRDDRYDDDRNPGYNSLSRLGV